MPYKNLKEQPENKTMTSRSVLNQETRVVSQLPQEDRPDSFMETISAEEAEKVIKDNPVDAVPEDFMHESIVAVSKSLMSQLDVKPKDSAIAFRWVNHKAYDGNSYFNHQNWGFSNALPEDIGGVWDTQKIKFHDGALVFGDLTLMKISKRLYFGYLKKNVQDADRNISRKNVQTEGYNEANKQFRADTQGIPAQIVKDRVGFYVPKNAPGEISSE